MVILWSHGLKRARGDNIPADYTGYFFDSSALGKRYHPEVGTAHVEALFEAHQPIRFISRLSVLELQSVFAGNVRTHAITEADLALVRARLLQDIAGREFRVIRMTDVHYREAERLIQQHGVRRSFRILDALQLSVALALQRRVALWRFPVVCATTLSVERWTFSPLTP